MMDVSRSSTLKVILINVILIMVFSFLAFALIEWTLRLYIPDTDHTGMNEAAPPPLFYRIKPNFSGILEGVKVSINSDGFRDDEFDRDRPENQRLIAVLGDSITFGQGVPQDKTFPAVLERRLNVSGPKGAYAVWNLGVPGYNTQQELAVFKSFVLPQRPHWVFLVYVINDVEPVNEGALRIIAGDRPHETPGWLSNQIDRSIGIQIVKNRLGRIVRWFRPDWYFSSYVDDAISQYEGDGAPWIEVSKMIESMKLACESEGIRFTVVMTPSMMDFRNYPFEKINRTVELFCRDRGIDYIDLLPYFRNSDPSELAVSMIDAHPNALAHEIMAKAILERIRKEETEAGKQ